MTAVHSGKLKGFYASTATLQEIIVWFFNRRMLEELILAINALVHVKNLEWVPITSDICCLTSTLLMSEYGLNPFDAYHAATAIAGDKKILSTEHVYDRVKGIERVDPTRFVNDLG